MIALLGVVLGACGGRSVDDGKVGVATGGTASTTTAVPGGTTSISRPWSAAGQVALGGTIALTTTSIVAEVAPCPGVPAVAGEVQNRFVACNGVSVEYEPMPVDMVILMDRSIANSYAVGDSSWTPAVAGQLRRWDVLIVAMATLAASPNAAHVGASLTLFGTNEAYSDASNCALANYVEPAVPMSPLSVSGPQMVATMRATIPTGLAPLVPALQGAYQYAMARKLQEPSRDTILVLFTSGIPTECSLKSPADVVQAISDAASAEVPVRTFVVGVGAAPELRSSTPVLERYARAGKTYKSPYLLDEAADMSVFPEQLFAHLSSLYNMPIACDVQLVEPDAQWTVDPEKVSMLHRPFSGGAEEYPGVANADACATSTSGGWYFDDPLAPTKLTLCPCSCLNSSAGGYEVRWACKLAIP